METRPSSIFGTDAAYVTDRSAKATSPERSTRSRRSRAPTLRAMFATLHRGSGGPAGDRRAAASCLLGRQARSDVCLGGRRVMSIAIASGHAVKAPSYEDL